MAKADEVMNQKAFSLLTAAIFTAIAVLHILRLLLGWEAIIGGWVVPRWVSWVALPPTEAFDPGIILTISTPEHT